VSEILRSLARVTALSLYHAEDIGTHYARTLAAWRQRFQDRLGEVRTLGFDERFVRMWDYYLSYCEGAFLERHIGDFQLLLTRNHSPRTLFGEPWGDERPHAVLAGIPDSNARSWMPADHDGARSHALAALESIRKRAGEYPFQLGGELPDQIEGATDA
jgi:hypothetical protein